MAEAISCCSKKHFKICYLSLESSALLIGANTIAEQVGTGNEETSMKVDVGEKLTFSLVHSLERKISISVLAPRHANLFSVSGLELK